MTSEEDKVLIELLNKIQFPCSKEVFEAIYRNLLIVAIELAVFTQDGNIILLPRPKGDLWEGEVHMPGSVMRPGDTEEAVLNRVMSEVGAASDFTPPVFINRLHFPKGPGRNENKLGQEVGLLFGCVFNGTIPSSAVLGNPDALPPNCMPFHRGMISEAHAWFKNNH